MLGRCSTFKGSAQIKGPSFQRGSWVPFLTLFGAVWDAFGCSGGSLAGLLGSPWGALGVAWAPLGASRWSFGVPLASFGVRWVSLGGPLVPQGGLLGGSWVAVWLPWCRLVRFLVALGVSRILLAFPRAGQEPSSNKKEQSKRKRDTPTRTQHPLQNRASRFMTHRLTGSAFERRPLRNMLV